MQGPWRYHIADFMMLFIGELWSRVQWRLPPGQDVMVPVIVNMCESEEKDE